MQVTGYVSATAYNGFYLQDSPTSALNEGIWVYCGTNGYGTDGREVGEQVQVTALVEEYYGLSELNVADTSDAYADVTSLSTGATMVPYETTTGAIGEECTSTGEEYEGLLVKLTNVEIVGEPNNYGEVSIDDGSGVTQLEDGLLNTDDHLADLLGTDTLTGQSLASITGVVNFAYGSFEVHPRTADDITPCIDDNDAVDAVLTGQTCESLYPMMAGLGLDCFSDLSAFGVTDGTTPADICPVTCGTCGTQHALFQCLCI